MFKRSLILLAMVAGTSLNAAPKENLKQEVRSAIQKLDKAFTTAAGYSASREDLMKIVRNGIARFDTNMMSKEKDQLRKWSSKELPAEPTFRQLRTYLISQLRDINRNPANEETSRRDLKDVITQALQVQVDAFIAAAKQAKLDADAAATAAAALEESSDEE